MNWFKNLFNKNKSTNEEYLFFAKDNCYKNWHSFIRWWSEKCLDDSYRKYKIDINEFTISEYPDGTLQVVNKECGNYIWHSGIWFYIDGIKIRLID